MLEANNRSEMNACLPGITYNKLRLINMKVYVPKEAAFVETLPINTLNTLQLWHERLGRQNKKHVKAVIHKYGFKSDDESCDGWVCSGEITPPKSPN